MSLTVLRERCTGCELCVPSCPFGAIVMKEGNAEILEVCNECGLCMEYCPENAILHLIEVEAAEAALSAKEEHRNIWVFIEGMKGDLEEYCLGVLGKARELADLLGTKVEAILMGGQVKHYAPSLIHHGADSVYLVENPLLEAFQLDVYDEVLVKLILDYRPEIVLFAATSRGNALASVAAAHLKTAAATNCLQLDIDTSERLLLATIPIYEARLQIVVATPKHRPQIVTIQTHILKRPFLEPSRRGRLIKVKPDVEASKTQIIDVAERDRGERRLETAPIVVVGGRGLGSAEGFKKVEELAEVFGCAVGASKAAVDLDWAPRDYLIEWSGSNIRPRLYIACGVSGSLEHLKAVQGSPFIVAIHSYLEDPIFKVADLAVEKDPKEIIPKLIKELSKFR
ncbi:MAG: 4Fe-4S dicluster domain-containing protein [Nitrososphaeria archaeon]|nr:4Fe-4S dicluster domain-containing protein [Nitrososphaeria archaeon]NIQ33473.1 4Fe-4S dicluster domain-containing protein [Nitrososphaeria archaeon]